MPRTPEASAPTPVPEKPDDTLVLPPEEQNPEPSTDDRGDFLHDYPDLEGSYDHKLAEKLVNPELSGMQATRDKMNRATVSAITRVEKLSHAGQDFFTDIKTDRLTARVRKSERKQAKYAHKAETHLFAGRREHFKRMAEWQAGETARHGRVYKRHMMGIDKRNKGREDIRKDRENAIGLRHEELLGRAREARARKAKRRMERIEAAGQLSLSAETRKALDRRHGILERALIAASEFLNREK